MEKVRPIRPKARPARISNIQAPSPWTGGSRLLKCKTVNLKGPAGYRVIKSDGMVIKSDEVMN